MRPFSITRLADTKDPPWHTKCAMGSFFHTTVRYIRRFPCYPAAIIPLFAISIIWLNATLALAQKRDKPEVDLETGCPINREHIVPFLRTVPADGRLYAIQRQAVGMHIDEVIKIMGGEEKAMALAEVTKALTQQKLDRDDYMTQAERRFNHDMILRSNALIKILKCRSSRTKT